jgi:glycosyltransferase involved in cell wall biosynthesis
MTPALGIITTSYPRTADDPRGVFVRDHAAAHARAGTMVKVLASGVVHSDGDEHGVRVTRVPACAALLAGAPEALEHGGVRTWLSAFWFSARLAAAAARRVRTWDAIESHWLVPCGLIASALASGRPHRAYAHGGDVALLERLPGGAGAILARWLVRRGADLVFASADLRTRFASLVGKTVHASVEAAPVDHALFRPRPEHERQALARRLGRRHELETSARIVLGVGRLVPIKGFDTLVSAVGLLPRLTRPAVVLAGEGSERPKLVALAAERGVSLRLLGAVSRASVAEWMAAADVTVHPARVLASGRVEGMPLAPREALACGRPVVATTTGGLVELSDQPGLRLIPPDDPAALAQALA